MLACWAGFSLWSFSANGRISVGGLAVLLVLVVGCQLWGRLLLWSSGAADALAREFGLCFLAGAVSLGWMLLLARLVLPFSVVSCLVVLSLLGAALYARNSPRMQGWQSRRSVESWGLVSLLLSLFAAQFWCGHLHPQIVETPAFWVYRPYMEKFAHALLVGMFCTDAPPIEVGSPFFAGEPVSFYHYASYPTAAAVALADGQSPLEVLSAFWFPYGLFLVGLSAGVLGRIWFSPQAGAWATLGALAVPDPTYWAQDITCFSYQRLLEASSSSAYAVASAGLALAMVFQGRRLQSPRLIASGLAVVAGTALYKVNLVVVLLPIAAWVLIACPPRPASPAVRRLTALYLLACLAAIPLGMSLHYAPTFRFDSQLGHQYYQWVRPYVPPGPFWNWLGRAWSRPPAISQLPARGLWLAWATWQWWLVAVLVAWVARLRQRLRLDFLATLPLAVLSIYLGCALLLAPNANGDPFELQHRHFVWSYFLLLVWLCGTTVQLTRRTPARCVFESPTCALAVLLLPLVLGGPMRMPTTPNVFSKAFAAAGQFVDQASAADEAVIDAQGDPWLVTGALCGRRAFVCRDDDYAFAGQGNLAAARRDRLQAIQKLLAAQAAEQVESWRQLHGARWFVVHPETALAWPAELQANPAFNEGGYRVFDLQVVGRSVPAYQPSGSASPSTARSSP